jgi:hypothetical protein
MAGNMSKIINLHPPHSDQIDSAEWRQTVEVLQASVRARDPDGLSQVSYYIRRIEQELGPLASSLAIMQARARGEGTTVDEGKEATMRARMQVLNDRLADLRPIISRARSAPKDSHDGPTPEARAKGKSHKGQLAGDTSILELPEGLRNSAMDLRCGWALRSPTSQHAKAVKLELEPKGVGEYGRVAEKLELQYIKWRKEMGRVRFTDWPIEDVVCIGRSIAESAKLRGVDPAALLHQVISALTIYHVLFPPVDTARRAGV